MKFKWLLLVALFVLPHISFAQQTGADSAARLIDTVLSYAKKNSIYRSKVNWQTLEDSVRGRAKDAAGVKEAMPALQLMYKMLGDFHGAAHYNGNTYKWDVVKNKVDREKYKALIAKFRPWPPKIEIHVLQDGYGYLLIPPNNPTHNGETEEIAGQIQDSLARLNPAKLKGLVIDLRLNTGGTLWPMLLGVGNLLSKGTLGTFVYPDATMNQTWEIKDTAIYCGNERPCTIRGFAKVNPKIKIALLTSPYTASSGEATVISFKGQNNARVIGDITGGYTTSNDSFQFYGVDIFMATSVEADRNGIVYYENVQPDLEVIAGDNFTDLSKDEKIIAALKWMKGK